MIRNKSRISKIPAFLLASLALTGALFSTGVAQGIPPTLVVTEPVKEMEFHDQITLIGRTEAKMQSSIVSEVAGCVTAVNALEGNYISKATPLVTIDSEKIALLLQAKEAEAGQARVQAELAASNLKRSEELYSQKLISETTVDSARAWELIARQRYMQLQAEQAQLARDLDNCVIRAPYSGYTLRKQVDVGEWVQPGAPVYDMVDLSEVLVVVDLPERYFGHLLIGSTVNIEVSSDTLPPIKGTVTGISRSASKTTHTFPVMVSVENREGRLGGGKLVRATLSLSDKFTSLAVSKDAVVRQGTQTFVYTVVDGKAVNVPVVTSSRNGKYVAVNGEGIGKDMMIVVRGNERIFPGSPVQVQGAAPDDKSQSNSETSASSKGSPNEQAS